MGGENCFIDAVYYSFQGSRLPKLSQQFMQARPVFTKILFMPAEDRQNRFGVFRCKIDKENITTEIVTLKLPPSDLGKIYFELHFSYDHKIHF